MPDVAGNTRVCVHECCHNAWTFPLLDKLGVLLMNVVAKSQAGNRVQIFLLFLSFFFSILLQHSLHTVLKLLNLCKILCNSFIVLNLSIKKKKKYCGLQLW